MAHPNAVILMIVETLCNTPKLLFNCSIALECGPGSEYFLPSRVSEGLLVPLKVKTKDFPRTLVVTFFHCLSCGRPDDQSVEDTGDKNGCKRCQN
jgi:hypothetical protein